MAGSDVTRVLRAAWNSSAVDDAVERRVDEELGAGGGLSKIRNGRGNTRGSSINSPPSFSTGFNPMEMEMASSEGGGDEGTRRGEGDSEAFELELFDLRADPYETVNLLSSAAWLREQPAERGRAIMRLRDALRIAARRATEAFARGRPHPLAPRLKYWSVPAGQTIGHV